MKRSLLVLLLLSTLAASAQERREQGNLVIEGIPEIPPALVQRLEQYSNTRSAAQHGWDPVGGGLYITTRFGETSQVHRVDRPMGARQQLTFFPEPIRGAAVSPDPARPGFLFLKDIGGSEFYQVFWFDARSGQSSLLTDGTSRHGSVVFSPSGRRLAYFGTGRNGTDWDIYVAEASSPDKARRVLEATGSFSPLDWASDERRLLVGRYVSINESYLYVLDTETGELREVNPSEEKIAYGTSVFSRDGRSVYLTSDEGSEFQRLRRYDLETGRQTVLTESIPWDIEELELSREGDRLAFTANQGGVKTLYLLDTTSGRFEQVQGLPQGIISGLDFHPAGTHLAFTADTPATPGDVFTLRLADGNLERWTRSEVGGLDTSTFVEPTLIEFPTFDGRKIPAFYYRPKGPGPRPVVIMIHGGPESQYTPSFSATVQYFVTEMGLAVLAPNVRGSSGYGKSYLLLDNGTKREDSVKDIGALLDYIAAQPELDENRVAVFGGSYGGYMVLASMTHFADRLAAGIDVVGISNFVTFLENTQDYRRDLRRAEYGDERDPEMRAHLERISPTNNARKITDPLLVVQGLNDPRVPATESEQMVDVIRTNGGTVWYLLAKDEGHGFRKKGNRDVYTQAVVLFLERFLLNN